MNQLRRPQSCAIGHTTVRFPPYSSDPWRFNETFPRRQALGMAVGGAVALGVAGRTPAGASGPADAAADRPDTPIVPPPPPVPVALDTWFTNDGIDSASAPGGDFDGSGYTFPAEHLPAGTTATVGGVPFRFGSAAAGAKNDVVATGQTIDLPRGRYFVAYFLVAASYGACGGTATVHYADGSTSTGSLSGPDWYTGSGALVSPFRYAPGGVVDGNPVSLATGQVWVDPAREAGSLSPNELRRLHRHLRRTLADFDERGGSHTGDLMPERHREGVCPKCGTPLLRRQVGGRTTYSCPDHQV